MNSEIRLTMVVEYALIYIRSFRMKNKNFHIIDGFEVVISISDCHIDPEATNQAIGENLGIPLDKVIGLPNFSDLYCQYAKIRLPGPTTKVVSDEDGTATGEKLAMLTEHEKLTTEGTVIPDWRGTRYYIKNGGTWKQEEIKTIGEMLPEGAVPFDNLNHTQKLEIGIQNEDERIASLTADQKASERQAKLDAATDEADRLSKRAQIQGNAFDIASYYAGKKAEIEAKYA
jgi:hypothetical protein